MNMVSPLPRSLQYPNTKIQLGKYVGKSLTYWEVWGAPTPLGFRTLERVCHAFLAK